MKVSYEKNVHQGLKSIAELGSLLCFAGIARSSHSTETSLEERQSHWVNSTRSWLCSQVFHCGWMVYFNLLTLNMYWYYLFKIEAIFRSGMTISDLKLQTQQRSWKKKFTLNWNTRRYINFCCFSVLFFFSIEVIFGPSPLASLASKKSSSIMWHLTLDGCESYVIGKLLFQVEAAQTRNYNRTMYWRIPLAKVWYWLQTSNDVNILNWDSGNSLIPHHD